MGSHVDADTRRASTIAFYDHQAEAYAVATMAIDTSGQVARFASLLPQGARVLDVGCGSGRDLVHLGRAGLNPVGLDLSPSLVAIARGVSGFPVTLGDLRNPPFSPASFEGVWAMASLLHLDAGEIPDALVTLRDLLVPGGVIFSSVKRGSGLVRDREGRWFTLHREVDWAGLLRRAGFEVLEVTTDSPETSKAIGSVSPGWVSSLARRP